MTLPDWVRRYGFALLVIVIGGAIIPLPIIQSRPETPVIIIFFIILLSAWYGGLGPGLLVTSIIAFLTLGSSFEFSKVVRLVLFLAEGALISILAEILHSARRRAEESQRAFAAVLTSIGDAVITTDPQGHVMFMNPVAAGLTGWTVREAKGKELTEVFPIIDETTRKPVETPVAKVLATGSIVGLANHTVLIARDKMERPIDDSASPIADEKGRILGVVLVFRDMTEQRRADEMRERLAAIVQYSDDAIISKDLDGIITTWNKAAEKILGYRSDEVIGKHVSMLLPEAQVEDPMTTLDRVRRGELVDHYETKRRRKDGTVIDLSLSVSPMRDADGRIVGASKIARDITEQKRAEKERIDRERRKDEFLAMLAHELRNPIASISSAVQFFGMPDMEHEFEWAKEVVERQVKHLTRLIDDLLDVSRITQRKIRIRKEWVKASQILNNAIEDVQPLIVERRHELVVDFKDESLRMDVDPARVHQVLVNLLGNAAKYTPNGGRIKVAVESDGKEVIIRVEDNGSGIPPESLTRMFDLFAQGERSLARSEGGLGIGLTIAKNLVELHGGWISAKSEGLGKGSEFTVCLPIGKQPPTASAMPSESQADPKQKSRILIIDDNRDLAQGLALQLNHLGYQTQCAYDGPAGIEAVRVFQPEVILLDIGLPSLDGYEVANRLRKEEGRTDLLIIAISGYSQEEDLRRSLEAGMDYHLAKPVDVRKISTLIAKPR